MVRVHQHDTLAIFHESEGSLVARYALVGKVLEDLLECRLHDAVLLDTQAALLTLELTEEPADRLVLLGHAQLEELSALLEDLDLLKAARQVGQDAEAVGLCFEELEKVAETDFTIGVQAGLSEDVISEAVATDLVQDQLVELGFHALVDRLLEDNFLLGVSVLEAKLIGHLLQFVVGRLAHFDLDLVSDAIFTLDVLRATHAPEDSASDHDSKLGGQCLSLLHRVCR